MKSQKIITVFGSSSVTNDHEIYLHAYRFGKELGESGYKICSGGYGGVMEAVSKGAKEGGGFTIGVTSKIFCSKANHFIDEEIQVSSHIERLIKLILLGDGYVVFRGGTGTLLEFVTVWEYFNKNFLESKPLVFIGDYWRGVIQSIVRAISIDGQTLKSEWMHIVASPAEAVKYFSEYFSSRHNF